MAGAGRSWYGPADLNQWQRRLFTARTFGLIVVCAVVSLTEFHFDWMEQLLGNYLTTTNVFRPKSGAIWEQGSQVDSARETLGQYSSQRQNSQIEARRATSLGQVLNSMGDENGTMVSAEHFIELFLQLPPAISHEIISPYTLLAKLSQGRWTRTFFERQEDQVQVYLLDTNNQVLDRLSLGPDLLVYINKGEVAVATGLDRLADFVAHIYPADLFFQALNDLDDDVRFGILSRPDDLLRISGRIRRVGISQVQQGDRVDLGFEVEDLDGPKVILMQGRYDAVQRLLFALEGRTTFGWPPNGEEIQ